MLESSGRENISVSCPICRKSDYKVILSDHNRRDGIDCSGTYVLCRECSLVYLRDRSPWEEIVKFYSSSNKGHTTNAGHISATELRQKINNNVPLWKTLLRKVRFRPHSWPLESAQKGSKRLLDLGCGDGAKLFEFIERGYDVWGVDVSTDTIRVCQEVLSQGHFLQGELHETGLPDSHFDYIRIDNALEHVPNPKEVMAECHRLLKIRGQILIYVPHGRSFSMRFMKGDSISSWIPFHLQLFTKRSLTRLLTEAGFKNIRITGYNPSSWLPMSFIQFKNRHNPSMELTCPAWLTLVCYPIGWFANQAGLSEELVGMGEK